MSLTGRILLAMATGILVGSLLNVTLYGLDPDQGLHTALNTYLVADDGVFDVVGRIFVASLKLLVVPLVLVSLICGTSSLGDSARMGPIAGKTMLLYLATTAVAVSVALFFAAIIDPGKGVSLTSDAVFQATEPPPLAEVLVSIFPTNPVQAMAEGNMLQIIVFAVLFGYAISHASAPGQRIAGFFRDLEAVVMKMVSILMHLAPYGVFALLAKLFSTLGIGAIVDLAAYFFTVLAVLVFHVLVIYTLMLKGMTGLSPRILLSKLRPVWAFAFSTASSGATIPITLRTTERRLGVHNSVAGFTIPLGATVNMDGTAIMQGVATVFIAQVYGMDLSMGAYITIVLTATLASIGTAAVPGAGLVMLVMVLEQVGLPVEGIALIYGVDRLLDMVRTAVNVTGDVVVSVIVAQSEQQLDYSVYLDESADQDEDDDQTHAIT